MRWKGRRVSTNVEDRRGGGGAKAGGISILGLVVAFVAWKFFGVDPQQAYQATKQVTSQSQVAETQGLDHPTAEQQEAMDFVGTVLADTEDTWTQVFQQQLNSQYAPPKLVLFSGVVNSGCGTAQSAMGPFYCPTDQKVYIDTSFFKLMHQQMGISGEKNTTELARRDQAGDFAQAYVVAHEVGHHLKHYWVFLSKCKKRVIKPIKYKAINCLYVRNYKPIALPEFGPIAPNNAPSS